MVKSHKFPSSHDDIIYDVALGRSNRKSCGILNHSMFQWSMRGETLFLHEKKNVSIEELYHDERFLAMLTYWRETGDPYYDEYESEQYEAQQVSENVPFSQSDFWREYEEGYRGIPNSTGERTFKSVYGDGKKYQLRDLPFKFGYQDSDMFWNEEGFPYRMKKNWLKDEQYAITEKANFGYTNKEYTAGIVKSKKNAPLILSEIIRISPLEKYTEKQPLLVLTWGKLKKQIKANKWVFATNEYDASILKKAFKYLPVETTLYVNLFNNAILTINFVYDGESWDFILAPSKLGVENEQENKAETKPPMNSKGLIVYPQRMAELIRDGEKTMIVKDKPLNIAGKRYTIVAKRKGYAYVQLGDMRVLTLPKFRALRDEHKITPQERAQYFKGKRRLFAWPVKVLKEFDKAYPTNAPLRPQDVAPKLKTYASEDETQEVVY